MKLGDAGFRSRYLSIANRVLFRLSYTPIVSLNSDKKTRRLIQYILQILLFTTIIITTRSQPDHNHITTRSRIKLAYQYSRELDMLHMTDTAVWG